jgi:hypothetical protein
MSITYKDYNRFFFETLMQMNGDTQELVIQLKKVVAELENVTTMQVAVLEKAIRKILAIEGDVLIARVLKEKYDTEWKEKSFKTFDFQTSAMLDYLSNMNADMADSAVIKELGQIITGFEVEYWNDSKTEDFYEAFAKMVSQLDEYEIKDTVGIDEIKITIDTGDNEQKVTQFNKTELSGMSQIMFNKMKATMDNFGEAVSYEEKMQVIAKLFSEMI